MRQPKLRDHEVRVHRSWWVATGLVVEARRTADQAEAIARPFYVTRIFTGLVILAIVTTALELWWLGGGLGLDWLAGVGPQGLQGAAFDPLGLAAGLEALVNLAILGSLALWFLINIRRALGMGRASEASTWMRA
ncbi:hypothetical protein [Brevundimonas sp. TWP2-3-2]|uniref:hypothetical protein n=1 Tax=unclassified Brevundimonas TaxID=2622653 RepID=UPI003CF6DD1D